MDSVPGRSSRTVFFSPEPRSCTDSYFCTCSTPVLLWQHPKIIPYALCPDMFSSVTVATPLNHTLCSLPGDMFSSVTMATPLNHTLCSLPGDMFSSVTVATPLNHTLCSLPGNMFSSVTMATPLNHTLCSLPRDMFSSVAVATPLKPVLNWANICFVNIVWSICRT